MGKLDHKNKKILFFDSGCGGLSICRDVMQLNPGLTPYYLFDHKYFPYSDKSDEFVIGRACDLVGKINDAYGFDIIVIACNTVSTIALPDLRARISTPIVGVVPAIKPAAKISKKKSICLLATKGTINRTYITGLIESFAWDCRVQKIGTTRLVEIGESKMRGERVDIDDIRGVLEPYLSLDERERADVMVLGCTHFHNLRDEIQQAVGSSCVLVDSGEAIAKRVRSVLGGAGGKARPAGAEGGMAFFTGDLDYGEQMERVFGEYGLRSIEKLRM